MLQGLGRYVFSARGNVGSNGLVRRDAARCLPHLDEAEHLSKALPILLGELEAHLSVLLLSHGATLEVRLDECHHLVASQSRSGHRGVEKSFGGWVGKEK